MVSIVTKKIIEPVKEAVSAVTKKIIKAAAPVTKNYWPILAIATILVIGIGFWVGKRRKA